jgi:hypothetical protein
MREGSRSERPHASRRNRTPPDTSRDEQTGPVAILSPANLDWVRRLAVGHSFHVVEMERVHDGAGRCVACEVEAIEIPRVSIVLEDNREAAARRISLKYCLMAGAMLDPRDFGHSESVEGVKHWSPSGDIPAHWLSRGHYRRSNANQRSQSAFSDPHCLGTSRLITGASNGNSSLRDPLGRKSSSLLSSVPSEVGLNVYVIVRSGFQLASNTSRDGRSYVVIRHVVGRATVDDSKTRAQSDWLVAPKLSAVDPGIPLRLVAEVGQRVEDSFGRAGDSGRRSGTRWARSYTRGAEKLAILRGSSRNTGAGEGARIGP